MQLKGKNIVITGASSGIGLAIVEELLKTDCRIIAVARSIDKINFNDDRVTKYACDISKQENIDDLFEFIQKEFENIDLFISNAGFAYFGQIEEPNWQDIDSIYRTNVFSVIYMAEKMKQIFGDKPFQFAITASAMSFLSYPGYTLYSSTKAALRGFAAAYRSELSKGQRIQMIYPIGTRTSFFETAGNNTPLPWPTQSTKTVAKAAVRGMKRRSNSIFPSKLFLLLNILNGYFPVIFKLIIAVENIKFKRWLRSMAT